MYRIYSRERPRWGVSLALVALVFLPLEELFLPSHSCRESKIREHPLSRHRRPQGYFRFFIFFKVCVNTVDCQSWKIVSCSLEYTYSHSVICPLGDLYHLQSRLFGGSCPSHTLVWTIISLVCTLISLLFGIYNFFFRDRRTMFFRIYTGM